MWILVHVLTGASLAKWFGLKGLLLVPVTTLIWHKIRRKVDPTPEELIADCHEELEKIKPGITAEMMDYLAKKKEEK